MYNQTYAYITFEKDVQGKGKVATFFLGLKGKAATICESIRVCL